MRAPVEPYAWKNGGACPVVSRKRLPSVKAPRVAAMRRASSMRSRACSGSSAGNVTQTSAARPEAAVPPPSRVTPAGPSAVLHDAGREPHAARRGPTMTRS